MGSDTATSWYTMRMYDTMSSAEMLWNYMKLSQPEPDAGSADCIIGLGSLDERVAKRSAQLWHDKVAPVIIFSGGVAHYDDLLKTEWRESEAAHFKQIAVQSGVPEKAILIEPNATNTGENAQFSQLLLEKHGIHAKRLCLVAKPYMERRAHATFMAQWKGEIERLYVTSDPVTFEAYQPHGELLATTIHIMVGDFERILKYPSLGLQIEQEVPENVMMAYEALVKNRFTKRIL